MPQCLSGRRDCIRAGANCFECGRGAEGQGHWWIKVKDSGPGLPERAKNNLFTAFQGVTTKGGSGLGLAISAELIRGHGGHLSLEKSEAQGSIFVIKLPKANI